MPCGHTQEDDMFKILIAEDDRELRQLFQHVLVKNGYTVTGVSNGAEGREPERRHDQP